MTTGLLFKTKDFEFDFSKEEIRLYRNSYNYQSIAFKEVNSIVVKNGSIVQNTWLLYFITGILYFSAIFLGINLVERIFMIEEYYPLNHSDIRRIGANIILIFSMIFFATFILKSILKKEKVMIINRVSRHLALIDLEKKGLLEIFLQRINDKFKIIEVRL